MDWDLAIEKHREALARILAMLVAMAGLANSFTSPLWGFEARSSGRASGSTVGREGRGDCEAIGVPGNVRGGKAEVKPALTLPRHLHRLILRLLRPAESAARRLIIVMARALVVAPVPPRRRKPRRARPSCAGRAAPASCCRPASSSRPSPPAARSACPAAARSAAPGPSRPPARPGRRRRAAHLVSRQPCAIAHRVRPSADARRSARRVPPRAASQGAQRRPRRPAATGRALRPLAGGAQRQSRAGRTRPPRLAAASGPAARPAPRPAGAGTRSTRSCTTSTRSPSTCWTIPTRRDATDPPLRSGEGDHAKRRRGRPLHPLRRSPPPLRRGGSTVRAPWSLTPLLPCRLALHAARHSG